MKRAHLTIAGVSCVVFAIGVAAWKLANPPPPEVDEGRTLDSDDDAPRKSKWFWQSDDSPETTPAPAAPTGWSVTVYLPDGTVAANAKVTALESAVLTGSGGADSHPLAACDDYRHLTTGAAALRAGKNTLTVLAELTTDQEGKVTFPERSWPSTFLVRVEVPGKAPLSVVQSAPMRDFSLPDRPTSSTTTLLIVDNEGRAITSARATIIDVDSSSVIEAVPNAEGRITVDSGAERWAIVEADGYFPRPLQLDSSQAELPVLMLKEGVVEVNTPLALGSFRLQLSKRHPREARVRDGKVVFEREQPGYVSVQVTEPGYLGTGEGQLDEGGRLVINLPVKRAGTLFLTVVDEQGNPVPTVTASLTQPADFAEVTSGEEGERLVLGPLGEGPGVLKVTAPGFRTRSQSIELKPGETDLEVVLAEAPFVRGIVVDGSGQPVESASVQVFADMPNDPAGVTTGPDGRFKLHVDEEGSWTIEASDIEGDLARAVVKVPAADVTLRLEPLGRAEVTVFGPDGHPAPGVRVLIAGADSLEPDYAETDEEGVASFESLVPGRHRIEIDERDTDFLGESRELTIRSGEDGRATIRLRAAAMIEGVVVDEQGAPLQWTLIASRDGTQSMETAEDGSFTLSGFEPGQAVEVTITHEDYVELSPSTLTAGAKNVKLKAISGTTVKGRVVDDSHEPFTEFLVNGVEHYADDGRFEAKVNRSGVLTVSDFNGASVELKTEGREDVGDVVIVKQAPFTGVVLDAQRHPVASARLLSSAFDFGEITTAQDGTFEANLLPTKAPIQIDARAGELAAVVEVAPGTKGPIEIVLEGPTRVEGLVRGSGRSSVATVIARGPDEQELQVDTDVQGRFTLTMTPGFWRFGTRASRAFSTFKISGREQRIELGAAEGACEITVRGTPLPATVFLVPPGTDWAPETVDSETGLTGQAPVAGVIELSSEGPAFVGRGVPCASFTVHATYQSEVVTQAVSLSQGGTNQLSVSPKRLSSVGAGLGMMRHPMREEIDVPPPLSRMKELNDVAEPNVKEVPQVE